jgi:toxin YoeB
VSWRIVFTKHAIKDAKKIAQSGLKPKVFRLLELLSEDPYQNPPPYEQLVGDLSGACSRRINLQLQSDLPSSRWNPDCESY